MKRRILDREVDHNGEMPPTVQLVERDDNPLGVSLVDANGVHRVPHSELVQLAMEITRAEEFVRVNASCKLNLIAEQMKFLQQQAINILTEAKESNTLHRAGCNFSKIPGRIYYLYERPSGQKYFSLLSLVDWEGVPPHEYIGAYRLEADMTWTPECRFNEDRPNTQTLVNRIISPTLDSSDLMIIEN